METQPGIRGKGRRFYVYGLIVLMTGGHLFCIAANREYWPFSHYPMFSGLQPDVFKWKRLLGVTEEGAEIDLSGISNWNLLGRARLAASLDRIAARNDKQSLEDAVRFSWRRYEKTRLAGKHHGPKLRGLRLYAFEARRDMHGAMGYSRRLLHESAGGPP